MLARISTFQPHSSNDFFNRIARLANEKAAVPGGPALLIHLGYLYKQEATQQLNRYLGLEKYWLKLRESFHLFRETVRTSSAVFILERLFQNIERIHDEAICQDILERGYICFVWEKGQLMIC